MTAAATGVPHELIRASAGTGKTYELTNRYLRLLWLGERPDEILASTFTRKAAAEIQSRVLQRLAQAALDDEQLRDLSQVIAQGCLTRDACLRMVVDLTRNLHRLRISTLDSFYLQLAGSFSMELGLPPGWHIVEEHEDAALRAEALEQVLDHEDPAVLLALVHSLTCGDTSRSLDRDVRDKVNFLYALYRETNAAAWQAVPCPRGLSAERLARSVDALRRLSIPQNHHWEQASARALEAAETEDWKEFMSSGLIKKLMNQEGTFSKIPISADVARVCRPLIRHARARLLSELSRQTQATWQLLHKFHERYQRLQNATRGFRFDEITLRLAEYLRSSDPARGAVRDQAQRLAFRLDAHLRHLLLDEFQDTSLPQWHVIRPLAQRITASESHESFFCVGDTKQAIYGWRGGVAEIFDAVTEELPAIQQRPLDTSWRSSPVIIGFVNLLFGRLRQHPKLDELDGALTRWQKQFNPHQTATPKRHLRGYVRLQAARAGRENEVLASSELNLRFAAEQVADLRRQAPGFSIGILTRENASVRRLIYELRELGVEASEEGGASLNDSAAVQLLLAYLQLADHPSDSVARYHVATSPLPTALEWPLWKSTATSRHVKNRDAPEGTPERFAFHDVMAGRRARAVRRQLLDAGYGKTISLWAAQLSPHCSPRELRRLEKLVELAYEYDRSATLRSSDFVRYVQAARVRDPVAADVRVMTVHQAKGLEFDIVLLPDLSSDLFGRSPDLVVGRPSPVEPVDRLCRYCSNDVQRLLPDKWQRLFQSTREQSLVGSLCVLYVAVTRAVHALYIIVSPSAESEKSLRQSYEGLLRAALTDGSPLAAEQVAFEQGDAEWFTHRPAAEGAQDRSTWDTRASMPPPAVRLAPPGARKWRGLERVSPSSLEGGRFARLPAPSLQNELDRTTALARGTLIHAWFEQVRWLDDYVPDELELRDVARQRLDLGLTPTQIEALLTEFRSILAAPAIRSGLSRAHYASRVAELNQEGAATTRLAVETERAFAVRDGERLLVGTIDRLVTICAGHVPVAADIIDYKTDYLPPEDPHGVSSKVAFYRPQIAAYRRAVATMAGLHPDRVTAQLLFVQSRSLVPL